MAGDNLRAIMAGSLFNQRYVLTGAVLLYWLSATAATSSAATGMALLPAQDDRPARTVDPFVPMRPAPAHDAAFFNLLAPAAGADSPLISTHEPEPVDSDATAQPASAAGTASPPAPQAEPLIASSPPPAITPIDDQAPIVADLPPSSLPPQPAQSAPLIAETPAASQPATAAAEPAAQSLMDSEPEPALSRESVRIAERIPSNLDVPQRDAAEEVQIDRSRDLSNTFPQQPATKEQPPQPASKHEAMGISISVNQPNPNLDYELEKAYDALATGQPSLAIEIYKNILTNDPKNKGALFGLATTYHRTGQLDKARQFYGQLLAIDPAHRDGLNNFLVLLADEAPQQALEKMAELASRNPKFSPIPAQMAVIYQRLGQPELALEHMFRAVALAPENLAYRYNLAILLDKQKKYDEAARLYRQLLEAAARGAVIPGNIQKIQQRLTFISSNIR
ncbi:MAG: tetratricopeptide repeat protein [Alphaproteobacteria bacterium]|nr:tetratricopeptide repeat protein [Alphaproteobacteria bacterium]